jgi:hypothetical protein
MAMAKEPKVLQKFGVLFSKKGIVTCAMEKKGCGENQEVIYWICQ